MMTLTQPRRRSWFDSLFDDFLAAAPSAGAAKSPTPAMNAAETADAFILSFELPGVADDDVQVQYDDGQLTVSAERKFESEKAEGTDFHRVEQRYGTFARSVTLPKDVSPDDIKASFKRGILTVTVPKSEPSRARRVAIESE